ncbi:mitotic interactor and substrate of PLK1-like [Clarias magur]|uniref:Mitotic interactor and substrate of PLK1-like n=1 Tax=Clarias magur TaxID=1594786 RepID=A0A8J4XKN3_CLAMG|nr:mitotic interactor and substrate of PLK1-like [Clarias magur]
MPEWKVGGAIEAETIPVGEDLVPWTTVMDQTRQSKSPRDAQSQGKGRILSHSYQTSISQDPVPAEDHRLSRIIMTGIPKRWVMKPLTPKLEKSDLRTFLSPGDETYSFEKSWGLCQNGDFQSSRFSDNFDHSVAQSSVRVTNGEGFGDVVQAKQVALSEDSSTSEDWQPSTPNSPGSLSSTDSRVGFYSFVDDPTSPEAEKNEFYMVSPTRQAKLSTLKEKSRFKLQTYVEDRKPEKLFEDSNGDYEYHIGGTQGEDNGDEKTDRMEIIRSQAPKKSPVLKEQWSALENLDLTKPPRRLIEGFSLCYSPVSPKPQQSEADPDTIDNQQIDFNAARKQFQMMERKMQNPFFKNSEQAELPPKLRERTLSEGAQLFKKDLSKTETLKVDSWKRVEDEAMPTQKELEDKSQTKFIDNLDMRLDNQGMNSTSVGSLFNEASMFESTSLPNETPIEREIRISQEREKDLRRSRGIFLPDTPEMVEIKTMPILSLPAPQIKAIKAKEPNRMSLFINRGIERPHQSPGLYDRGSLHHQGERKKTFGSLSDQLDSITSSTSINATGRSMSTDNTSTIENHVHVVQRDVLDSKEPLSPCCPHRHLDETVICRESTAKIPGRTSGTSSYSKELAENNEEEPSNQPFWMADYKPKESRRTFAMMYSLPLPPEAVRNSRSTGAPTSLSESSSEWPGMLNAPDIIRREIEEDLRREQELQELRESNHPSNVSEPALSPLTTSDEVFVQSNNKKTSINNSYENVVEVEAVQPQKTTQRTSNSSSYSWNVDPIPVTSTSVPGPRARLSSIMTAQPWSGPKHTTPAVHKAGPTIPSSPLTETFFQKGLTKTLLEDFEERRARLKLEESAYAGIQPVDDINNEVVEVTRVIRHKNTRALRWEAGVYANEEDK